MPKKRDSQDPSGKFWTCPGKLPAKFSFCPVTVSVNGVEYPCRFLARHTGPHRSIKISELENKTVEVLWPVKKGEIGNVARVRTTIEKDHRICKVKTKYFTPR